MKQLISRVASLQARDREWLLARLSRDEYEAFQAMISAPLDEDRSAVPAEEPSAVTGDGREDEMPDENQAGVRVIDRLRPAIVSQWLANEPEQGVALLLAVRKWNWTDQYLFALPVEQGRRLKALAAVYRKTGLRPAVRDAVIRHGCSRFGKPDRRTTGATPDFERVLGSIQTTENTSQQGPGG